MKKPPLAISDLLAHRDGEPLDLELADEIAASAERMGPIFAATAKLIVGAIKPIVSWLILVSDGIRPTADEGIGGQFAVIVRDDGSRQVTYEGAPLYLFTGDSAPGQTNGHGVGDVWFVAAQDDPTAPAR